MNFGEPKLVKSARTWEKLSCTVEDYWALQSFIGLSKERPILGDHPKPHKTLYEKCCAFLEKHCTFREKAPEKWKATKTADSTQISHLDLVFHRVRREGQLCMFWWCLVVHMCVCWCMYVYVVHLCTHICVWWCMNVSKWSLVHEKWHFAWKAPEKWKAP